MNHAPHKLRNTLLCFLDKSDPPQHSFVDDMLAKVVATRPNRRVILVVSSPNRHAKPYRYYQAICLPSLFPRKGIGRLLNYIVVRKIIYTINKNKNRSIISFVRNDPILLLGSVSRGKLLRRIVFQSSHPHEELDPNLFKRFLAKSLYRICSGGVDAILAVSPHGLERIRRMFPNVPDGDYVPLLTGPVDDSGVDVRNFHISPSRNLRIIYTGSHRHIRRIDVVFEALARAVERGARLEMQSIGATDAEIATFRKLESVRWLEAMGLLTFTSRVPRSMIPSMLREADIGSCLIAPRPEFLEMSPTKLAEYMAEGLAVIASRGIPMQEQFVHQSGGGAVVDWKPEAISQTLVSWDQNRDILIKMKHQAKTYAREKMQYQEYAEKFDSLLKI